MPEVPIQCNFCLISGLPGLVCPSLPPPSDTNQLPPPGETVQWRLFSIFPVSSEQGNIFTGKYFPGESLSDIQCRGTPWPHCLKLRVSPNSAVMTIQKLARPSYRVTALYTLQGLVLSVSVQWISVLEINLCDKNIFVPKRFNITHGETLSGKNV